VYSPLLAGLALALGAPAPKADPPTLVGEWVSEKGVIGGDDRAVPAGNLTLTFTADGQVQVREGAKPPDRATYKADPKKAPAEIDIDPPAVEKAPAMTGIYKVEGDTLTLCLSRGGKRPAKFESPAGSDLLLLTSSGPVRRTDAGRRDAPFRRAWFWAGPPVKAEPPLKARPACPRRPAPPYSGTGRAR